MEDWALSRRLLLTSGAFGTAALASSRRVPASQTAEGAAGLRYPGAESQYVTATVHDFMSADQIRQSSSGHIADCTQAFDAAQEASLNVCIPPGDYGLDRLRLKSGVHLTGPGYDAARLHQINPANPVIDCLSDQSTGQLAGINVTALSLHGHAQASVAVLRVAAFGAYAVWRSSFDYFAKDCHAALLIEGHDSANVFRSSFKVTAEGVKSVGVKVTGGVYNDFDLFISQCASWAMDDSSTSSVIRVVGENCMIFRGQNNQISARIEEIPLSPAGQAAIEDRGFGNLYLTPTVIITTPGKVAYALRPFSGTVFLNPQIVSPTKAIDHPFSPGIAESFTVVGGRNGARNRMDKAFDGSDDRHELRLGHFIGDPAEFLTVNPAGHIQLEAPEDAGTIHVGTATRYVALDTPGTIATLKMAFLGRVHPDGRVVSFRSLHGVNRVIWPISPAYTGLPDRIEAGHSFILGFIASKRRWVVIG